MIISFTCMADKKRDILNFFEQSNFEHFTPTGERHYNFSNPLSYFFQPLFANSQLLILTGIVLTVIVHLLGYPCLASVSPPPPLPTPRPHLTFINVRAFMATLKFFLIWQGCTEALSLFPDKNLACFTIPDIN